MEILFLLPVVVVGAGLLVLLVLAAVSHESLASKQSDSRFTASQADATGLFLLGADSLPHHDTTNNCDHSQHASHVDHQVGSYDSGFHGSHYDAGSSFGRDASGSFDGGSFGGHH